MLKTINNVRHTIIADENLQNQITVAQFLKSHSFTLYRKGAIMKLSMTYKYRRRSIAS